MEDDHKDEGDDRPNAPVRTHSQRKHSASRGPGITFIVCYGGRAIKAANVAKQDVMKR